MEDREPEIRIQDALHSYVNVLSQISAQDSAEATFAHLLKFSNVEA